MKKLLMVLVFLALPVVAMAEGEQFTSTRYAYEQHILDLNSRFTITPEAITCIQGIAGVEKVELLARYTVFIQKGRVFEWYEILPDARRCIGSNSAER